jgi:hypothetical protein
MKNIDRAFFQNPTTDPDYSVSGFWFWNDLITDEKTAEQLALMKRIHANQPVIHARFGLENEYLSEDWFARVQSAVDNCRQNGQKIWLYDENNWPSGNCSWTITRDEEFREHFLLFDEWEVPAGGVWQLDVADREYLAVTAFLPQGRQEDVLALAQCGSAQYAPGESARIVAVRAAVDDYEPMGKLSVDYLNKEAIGRFIRSTYEKYKKHFSESFGEIIRGIFMDETRFCNALPWTKTLPQEFEARKGYCILPHLPSLRHNNAQAPLFRHDYYDVISELYAEATFKQVFDWCEANGLQSTGHLLGEETIAAQSYFGADMLRCLKHLHLPGVDHLGNGIGSLNAKFVVGASRHYGKDRISCEAFDASGWDISYEDMVRISNWLFQQGVNLILMHGFYYSIRDERCNDFPPSYFYQWKYWDKMPEYVLMANRMMEMLSGGAAECEILVYSPIESFWSHFTPDLDAKTGFWADGPWIGDEDAKRIDNQFQLVCNRLADENLDYEIIGADAMRNFQIANGHFENTLTGVQYSVFVLPCAEVLTEEAVKLLDDFAAAGGRIISYQSNVSAVVARDGRHMRGAALPGPNAEAFCHAQTISDVARRCRERLALPFEILSGPDRMAHSRSSYPPQLIDPYIHDGERVYGVGVTRYLKKDARIFNLCNYNQMDEEMTLWIDSPAPPELFNPETGGISAPESCQANDQGYTLRFTLLRNRSLFVVCPLAPA